MSLCLKAIQNLLLYRWVYQLFKKVEILPEQTVSKLTNTLKQTEPTSFSIFNTGKKTNNLEFEDTNNHYGFSIV